MSMIKDNLIGKTFHYWTVLALEEETSKCGKVLWKCRCKCGTIRKVVGMDLKSGRNKSCGCYRKEQSRQRATKHGGSHTRLYRIWAGMKQRCLSPNARNYRWYGAKGITIDETWKDYKTFQNWALTHGYQEGLTLDRKNPAGNYEPDNCQWLSNTDNANKKYTDKCTFCPLVSLLKLYLMAT